MVTAVPRKMNIEITTKCNGGCVMCPHGGMNRTGRYMSVSDIMDTVDEAYKLGIRRIHPHLFGEPTIHPDYIMIISRIRERYPDVKMLNYTNGSRLFDDDIRKAMIDNLDGIVISIDGASDFMMKMIRPGIEPTEVREGVHRLFRDRTGRKPHLKIRMTEMESNKAESGKMYHETWGPYCDDIFIAYLQDFHGFRGIRVDHRGPEPCDRIFSQVIVTVDRRIVLCCDDYREEVVLGDLNKNTMKEIWFGVKMEQIRNSHLTGRSKNILMCRDCSWKGKLNKW